MIDTHIHTHFSHDSTAKIEDYIEKAIDIGLNGITITDHIDHELFVDGVEPYNFDLNEYISEINSLRDNLAEKYPNFKLLLGVEQGYNPPALEKTYEDIKILKPDYVISSAHLVNNVDIYLPEFYLNRTKEIVYKEYLEYIISNVEIHEDFDSIGHIGYICRYARFHDKLLNYEDFKNEFDKLFNLLIKREKALEVNTSGYKTINQTLPNDTIISAYIRVGGKLITLGSDSHTPETLGMKFEETAKFIKKCGLDYITYFEQRKPKFIEI